MPSLNMWNICSELWIYTLITDYLGLIGSFYLIRSVICVRWPVARLKKPQPFIVRLALILPCRL
jgi:hypothetical protein